MDMNPTNGFHVDSLASGEVSRAVENSSPTSPEIGANVAGASQRPSALSSESGIPLNPAISVDSGPTSRKIDEPSLNEDNPNQTPMWLSILMGAFAEDD